MTTSAPLDLVLDCDPGIDDALALFLAAAPTPHWTLRAVTTVAGNRPLAHTTRNARALLALAGRPDVPVHAGADAQLDGQPARTNLVHGEDGLGGVVLPEGPPAVDEPADVALCRMLNAAAPGTLTLVAVGPLTNLARAERRQPGVLARAGTLAVMGGAVDVPGNVTPAAEFNVWADPLAAAEVLRAHPAIRLFGLDVTAQAGMPAAWIDGLGALGGRCAVAAHTMLGAYAAIDPLLHDACPLVHLLDPSLFEGRRRALAVETSPGEQEGRTHPVPAVTGQPLTEVMHRTNGPALLAHVHAALARLP